MSCRRFDWFLLTELNCAAWRSPARRVGAHHTVRSDAETVRAIRDLVGPPSGGVDVVLAASALSPPSMWRALWSAPAATSPSSHWLVARCRLVLGTIPLEARVVVPVWAPSRNWEVNALARARRISAHVERFSLDDAQAAYEKLRAGRIQGRAVIIPGAA